MVVRDFHPLRVAAVERLCDDAVAVTFEVPDELADRYAFRPGQALTVRRPADAADERRTYSICALLLDIDDPSTVIGQTAQPLITPGPDDQDGYVPNVVYSCGALRHDNHLVVPLGIADSRIGFATLSISAVLAAMVDGVDPRPKH